MPELLEIPGIELLGQEVELGSVERELQAFFADESEGEDSGIARASLMNLVVYGEDPNLLEPDARTVEEITREAACRVLLISANSAGDVGARAWVQAQCQIAGSGRKTVCTEQIAFHLTGVTPGLVRNTVFAHLDSDLPLVYWWRGELSEVFEERLYSRMNRLLFDSETWANPLAQFVRVAQAVQESPKDFSIHDLSFTRLNPVRSAIAKCFDNPQARAALKEVDQLEIKFGKGHRMSAILLAAWIADRLGLDLDKSKSGADRFRFDQLRVELAESDCSEIEDEAIPQLCLSGGGSRFELRRCQTKDFRHLKTQLGQIETESLFPASSQSDAALVAEILTRAGSNRTLVRILPLVREMLAAE